ncbi:hypothetical protein [Mycobacterium sp. AZCC_0083]|uniref:hypothetical protein n=1 Tax=Mycobacterium sp. AZCC_0083 TaxID=2735882 RepID=UPI00161F1019|nr:hypothetical protein [Mycobacterium sp. AZCC_0083]MBB5162486.1 hypothetical protein [Mycobacterium sp. AZCC_0083]
MTDTIGAQYPQPDPRGWLVFHGLPDDLQRAEDSTQHADYLRQLGGIGIGRQWDGDVRVWYFERPVTDAERTLLTHLGYTLPDVLKTRVDYASETLRRRTWPQLETQEVTP